MKSVVRTLLSLSLAIVIALPLIAADREKKARKPHRKAGPAAGILKRLEKAELTEEQVAKIKELAAASAEKMKAAREKAGLTDEQKAALKKAKEEGKKGKDLQGVVQLSEEQKAAMKAAGELRGALMKEVMALLTPEQKAKAGIKERGKKGGERKPHGKKRAAKAQQ